jgi:serine/threonine protein phosphatase PrpC
MAAAMTQSIIHSAGATDTGLVRKANEDAMIALPEAGLFCVADGMGGVAGGAFASQNILESLESAARRFDPASALDIRIACLREAVAKSNQDIRAWAENQGVTGTGTTLVLLTFDPGRPEFAALLHAGDSRAYLLRDGVLQQLTRDHSAAASFGDGTEESVPALFRNVVTNAIGMSVEVQLDETLVSLRSGDLVLLCSDGLYRMVAEPVLTSLLRAPLALEDCAASLVKAANTYGGRDNITAVLVRIGKPAGETKHGTAESETHDTDMRLALELSRQANMETRTDSRSLTDELPQLVPAAPAPAPRNRVLWPMMAVILGLVAAAIYLIGYGGKKEATVLPVTAAPLPPQRPVTNTAPAVVTPEPLADLIAHGFETGDWSIPPERLANLTSEEVSASTDSARAWMDVWREVKSGFPNSLKNHELYRADMETIVRVWNPAFAATTAAPWPDDPAGAASAFCLAQFRLQEEFFSELDNYVSSVALVIKAFGKNPADCEARLRAASLSRLNEPPVMAGQVQVLHNLVRGLNRWKERSRHLPLGALEIRNVTATFLEPVESGLRNLFISAAEYAAAIPDREMLEAARPEIRSFYQKRDAYVNAVEVNIHINGLERENLAMLLRGLLSSAGLKDLADANGAAGGSTP